MLSKYFDSATPTGQLELSAQGIKLFYDQDLVNWINIEYPDYNWFVGSPCTQRVSLFEDETVVMTARQFDMNDFSFSAKILFDPSKELIEKLIRKVCEYLTSDLPKGSDLYLLRLIGRLTYVEPDDYISKKTDENGNILATVGITWKVSFIYDDRANDEES